MKNMIISQMKEINLEINNEKHAPISKYSEVSKGKVKRKAHNAII